MTKKYDENAVQTLDALTHIRMRSGMYIGRLGDGSHPDDGIYILLKEILDNSVDEFIMGMGHEIVVNIDYANGQIDVRDFGRGIPLGKLVDCVSQINTGAKYNDDVFQFSVGLNGVGSKAVNALSSLFIAKSFRENSFKEVSFAKGILQAEHSGKTKEPNGTSITFIPDIEIFKKFTFQEPYIVKRLWHYAYLNRGLKIIYNGQVIESENGLLDLLNAEISEDKLYDALHFQSKNLEFAFLHIHSYGETYFSFVNGQHTADGGTHLSAFREGLLKGVNDYAGKSFQGIDLRDGIVAAVLVKVREPIFESQTKNKLSNTEIRAPIVQEVKEAVSQLLYKNPEIAKKLIERIVFNEKLRKELAAVKKEASEKQKKISYKIPQLRDCKFHYNDQTLHSDHTMIFLTEGESASASIVASRDVHLQAVFSLRGKPLNVHGMKLDQLYKNEEMYNLMSALNIEDDLSDLRYNKVVLATDADVDGMHIRNLLMTFFLTYFEGLVVNGHLYVLETPLFKVRNREKTIYCFSEAERDQAIASLKPAGLEITRFKGLGEISPHEFKPFIGSDMRLTPINVTAISDIRSTLEFYMGKNTPERKKFITKNLINEEAVLQELAILAKQKHSTKSR